MRDHEHSDGAHREVEQTSRPGRVRWSPSRGVIATCLAAAGFALLSSQAAVAQTVRTWNVTSGTWSVGTNWGGSVPTASELAAFSGATVGSQNATVLLSDNRSVLGMSFNSAGTTTLQRDVAGSARTLTLGTSGIAVNSGAGAVTIGVAGSLVNLVLNGSQTFTNDSSNLLSALGTINTTGSVGSDLTIAGSGSTTLSGIISGGAGRVISVRKQGSGVLTLSGANSYTGGFTLEAGTVVVGTAGALGGITGTVTISGGTLDTVAGGITTNANPQTWSGDFAFLGTGTLTFGNGAVTMTASRAIDVQASRLAVGGAISGAGFGLTKNGAGALRLSNANTFSGGVTLNAGTLELGNAAALGSGTLTIANSGVALDASAAVANTTNNNAQAWNGDFTFVGSNTLNLGSGAVAMSASRTVTVNASTLTVGGVISGEGFGLTKAGAGSMVIGGVANTYTGATTINQGALVLTGTSLGNGGAASPLGASSNAAANLILNGGTLRTESAAVVMTTDRLFTIGTGGATLDSSGGNTAQFNFTNTGNIAFQGSGSRTLTLTSGVNNRTGSFAPSLGDGPGGATSLVKSGANTWTVTGNLTFTGGVTVDGGSLLFSGSALAYSGGVTVNTGTFGLASSGTLASNIVNNGEIRNGGGSTAATYSGVISGSGSVNPNAGNSQLDLTNANNSYTGFTRIHGSPGMTLRAVKLADGGLNSSIGASSNDASNLRILNSTLVYVGSGDDTDRRFIVGGVGGAGANVGTIQSSGSGALRFTNAAAVTWEVAGQTGSLTLGGTNTGVNTLAALIADNGASAVSFTKNNAGRWALTGDNTYTGATTVSAGTLLVNGNQSSATGPVSVAAAATLGGSGTLGGATTFTGASLLRPGSSGSNTGVLGFGSSLALSATGTTFIDVAGNTRGTLYDGVDVGAGLTYGGSIIFNFSALIPATSTLDIFSLGGAASGSFSSVTATGSYGSITFTNNGSGLWSSGPTSDPDTTMTFNQSTGDINVVVVPEPAAVGAAILGAALVGLGWRRRRRR